MSLPVPVRIVWAEDTPIVTLTDVGLPLLGTYSARVMFFGRFYAGNLTLADKARILTGRPPVSVGRAIRTIFGKPPSS